MTAAVRLRDEITMRTMRPAERSFVAANWRRTVLRKSSRSDAQFRGARVYRGTHYARFGSGVWIDPDVWIAIYDNAIDTMIECSSVVVACGTEDMDEPLGFAVFDGGKLHFVFVLKIFRRRGIGSLLLAAASANGRPVATHLTPDGEALLRGCDGIRTA